MSTSTIDRRPVDWQEIRGLQRARCRAKPARDNTAVLLRDAYLVIERVVPLRLAERGHGAFRVAHGAVFQHVDESGTTVSVLAERAGMTKQAMAELVQYLEEHGYVRRGPDPENDARNG